MLGENTTPGLLGVVEFSVMMGLDEDEDSCGNFFVVFVFEWAVVKKYYSKKSDTNKRSGRSMRIFSLTRRCATRTPRLPRVIAVDRYRVSV